ncbi:MAG: citrate lyase ACP [Candidatus Eisenbacteria bacterium]|nr:citrate lyase ACP [Candidatus Eisenbacteria bacterium]
MSRKGQAGRKEGRVRSDCWVSVEPRGEGGVTVSVESIVAPMYGEAIERDAVDGLSRLGVEHAAVRVVDAGALPFVLDARLEAAARRAIPDLEGELLPEAKPWSRYGTSRDRFRRSRLYLPGDQPKFMVNAGLHSPDGVILDLEDSVAPSEKDAARYVVRNALRAVDFKGAERMVRINQLPEGLEDLDYIVPHNVHVILIPKCESPDDVAAVDERVVSILADRGMKSPVYLMPIVESALGCWRAYEIASASKNVVALTIGLEDYTADIGTQRTNKGRESFWARSQVVNAARAARVQPIDTVFSDVSDMDGLLASVREAKSLGFDGKGCIHPRQIEVIHRGFAPTEEELEKAKRIVQAFEKAESEGLGVVSLGSKMIDPPVVKRAQRTVELAIASGILPENWREGGDDV